MKIYESLKIYLIKQLTYHLNKNFQSIKVCNFKRYFIIYFKNKHKYK